MCVEGVREGGKERGREGKMRGRRGERERRENLQVIELIETLRETALCTPNQAFYMKEWRKTTLYRR